jgi:hypothetical protein
VIETSLFLSSFNTIVADNKNILRLEIQKDAKSSNDHRNATRIAESTEFARKADRL